MPEQMDRGISPPPTKRRKLHLPAAGSNPDPMRIPGPRSIRIFSWNINGIEPYLPSSFSSSSHKITSFFIPSSRQDTKPKQPRKTTSAAGPNEANANTSSSLRAFLARHNWPEVLFLQELKIAPANASKAMSALLSALNTPLPTENGGNNTTTTTTPDDDDCRAYQVDAVLPRDRYNARGFGGRLYGVATILRKDFAREQVACVRGVEWDLEGRVSVVELSPTDHTTTTTTSSSGIPNGDQEPEGKPKPLALINLYAVNGTPAPYRDPMTGAVIGTRHDHKLAFHTRLRDECLELEEKGFRVVVAGDVNVARGWRDGWPGLRSFPRQHCVNRADFNRKFFGGEDNRRAEAYVEVEQKGEGEGEGKLGREEERERCLDAVDVFRAMHGGERRYTYYPRTREWGSSCDRVDLILVSKALWEEGRVLNTGILDTPQERGLSDHVPLWVEIALEKPSDGAKTVK